MKEPTEKITKVHFHIGQQFGNKVKNSVDIKDGATMSWHQAGIKILWNGVTRVCSLATVHGVDCEDQDSDRERFDASMVANEKRGPGRPRVNA